MSDLDFRPASKPQISWQYSTNCQPTQPWYLCLFPKVFSPFRLSQWHRLHLAHAKHTIVSFVLILTPLLLLRSYLFSKRCLLLTRWLPVLILLCKGSVASIPAKVPQKLFSGNFGQTLHNFYQNWVSIQNSQKIPCASIASPLLPCT